MVRYMKMSAIIRVENLCIISMVIILQTIQYIIDEYIKIFFNVIHLLVI